MNEPKTVEEVLRQAAQVVRKGWARFRYARDKHGCAVDVMNKRATHFCAIGAIIRVCGSKSRASLSVRAQNCLEAFLKKTQPSLTVPVWNDGKYNSAREVARTMEEVAAEHERQNREV